MQVWAGSFTLSPVFPQWLVAVSMALIEIMISPLGQLIESLLQEGPSVFEMIAISMRINMHRLSPDEDAL